MSDNSGNSKNPFRWFPQQLLRQKSWTRGTFSAAREFIETYNAVRGVKFNACGSEEEVRKTLEEIQKEEEEN